MTAYSFKSYAARDRKSGERTQLVTIKHGHPLNNDHRAPFASGSTAARALLAHAQRELANPETGPAYFNQLRQIHDGATVNGERVKKRLQQRQARAATALSNSDVELTGRQLELTVEIAQVQAEIARRLLPEITASGLPTDAVIDNVDVITRQALRAATTVRTGETVGDDVDPNAWGRNLMERLARTSEGDRPAPTLRDVHAGLNDAEVVNRFTRLVYDLESELPLAIDRDEPLYEISEALDPTAVAMTRDALSQAQYDGFQMDNADLGRGESLNDAAIQAVYENMTAEEREFAATKIALSPAQRIEVGMQIVNSTPPLIQLPEAELGQGRYDVRMSTEEESNVMDALIQWAGQTRAYPGPEQAHAELESMKSLPIPSGELGPMTYGIAVHNNPAAISHASKVIAGIPADARVVIHADNPQAAEQLMAVRTEALRAAGIERPFMDGSDATREFGGWTLRGDADRILGADPRDAQVFVAASDRIVAYNGTNSLDVSGLGNAQNRVQETKGAYTTAENEVRKAEQAVLASRDPKLVDAARALDEKGGDSTEAWAKADASATKKLVSDLERRKAALRAVDISVGKAVAHLEKMERQNKTEAFRRATPGDIARAQITEAANRQGKLHQVFVPSHTDDKSVIGNGLVEQRQWVAAKKAETLLDGDTYRTRELRESLGSGLGSQYNGRRALTATLVAGSNWFTAERKDPKTGRMGEFAKKGLENISERVSMLPKTGVILVDDNEKNPVTQQTATSGRRLIHATAWRVTDRSTPMMDGRRVTLSERKTELDLGTYVAKGKDSQGNEIQTSRSRTFSVNDLKGSVVVVHGGGQMSRATYDAIHEHVAKMGRAMHALTPREALQVHAELVGNGAHGLDAPKAADPKLARAIMQEALVDYADQAIIGTDLGRDYHSANLIRQAIDTDKLAALVDKDGKAVDLATGYEHALQYAPSIADNTRRDLDKHLGIPAQSDYGQLILGALPGVNAERAAQLGQSFDTIGDILRAAENNEASPGLPPSLHHELSRPSTWANAVARANEIADFTDQARMEGVSATSEAYPQTLREAGRTPMIYTMKDVDLNVPTVALVIGGDSKPNEADLEAAKTIATEAHAKGWAVSLHLSGDASAAVAKELAGMPDESRPRILLVGDGHPTAHGNSKAMDAVISVAEKDGGGYATVTAPLPRGDASKDQIENDEFSYVADRRAALDFQARQASAVVLVKSTGNDLEMLSLRTAIGEGKPIAAVGPVQHEQPELSDLRFRGSEYSANRRLLAGGDAVTVMLDSRHLAFQPNFIPDMTAQTENRYVPFEGSTAGKTEMNDRRGQDDEIDRSQLESGSRQSTQIAWGQAAQSIQDGRGLGTFLQAVEDRQVESIAATQEQINARSLANDARFLDVASRSNVSREIREVFNELEDVSRNSVDIDVQDQFLRQRAGASR